MRKKLTDLSGTSLLLGAQNERGHVLGDATLELGAGSGQDGANSGNLGGFGGGGTGILGSYQNMDITTELGGGGNG